MAKVTKIMMVVHAEDLFAETDGLDTKASAVKFQGLVVEALKAKYPNAEINVDLRFYVTGHCPKTYVELDRDMTKHGAMAQMEEEIECADDIAQGIWESFDDWLVKA